MTRVVSVWLPQFPIERLRRASRSQGSSQILKADNVGSGAPESGRSASLALVAPGAKGLRISAVNNSAAAAGIVPGQSLADAKASMPGLRTMQAQTERDHAELIELSRWTGRYGPARNIDGADGLWIDITGVAHLFGGEEALLEDLQSRLSGFGHAALLGLADTAGAAWALARFTSEGRIALPGSTRISLSSLPVEALRLSHETVRLLKRLGLYQISQLYGLPRAQLALRFRDLGSKSRAGKSKELADTVMIRLDQALGEIREPRRPLEIVPKRLIRQVYAEPLLSSVGIEAAISSAIAGLCTMMAEAGEGARRLLLFLYRVDGSRAELTAGTSGPSRNFVHLEKLLLEKLASVDLNLGFGADVVTLEAVTVEPLMASQSGLGSKSDGDDLQGLQNLIDRLSNRLEPGDIHRVAPVCSHIPEQADSLVPVLDPSDFLTALIQKRTSRRPAFLLSKPEMIAVMAEVPEGPPRQFKWRRVRHNVLRSQGPERIEPAWWESLGNITEHKRPRPRDYYLIEDDKGGRYWVFREGLYDRDLEDGSPSWYVHGLFG